MKRFGILLVAFIFLYSVNLFSQENTEKKNEGYKFETIKQLKVTPVKDQSRSGTCWSFSTVSFLESELIRTGKGEFDLSEMFFVRKAYSGKAENYVRMHGSNSFGGGGEAHDVINIMRKYGLVPNEVYSGKVIGEPNHIHGEMDAVLKGLIDEVVKNGNGKLSPVWRTAFDKTADAYLGEVPQKFTYKGKEYSPQSFAQELGLNPDDYVEIGSFTHHPFYTKFILEVPDNWAWGEIYNVPIDELIEILDNSIDQGYSVAWASDVSEKGFSYKNGVAIVPEEDTTKMSDQEKAKWAQLTDKEKEKQLNSFEKPGKEKAITQDMRQQGFDNYSTTDDHGMHIFGTAKDQNGTKYYMVKNSWGNKGNDYKGYFYTSVPFVRYKTMYIMVNKNAIPKNIRKKLNL
ncbi:MAG: aminopeptidase [Bacteroidia bacterium]|nr:aminopeptidase [Bacteroidia bacterium]